jgi:hypothetical protein
MTVRRWSRVTSLRCGERMKSKHSKMVRIT